MNMEFMFLFLNNYGDENALRTIARQTNGSHEDFSTFLQSFKNVSNNLFDSLQTKSSSKPINYHSFFDYTIFHIYDFI